MSCECSREYKTKGQWKFEEHETLVKLSLYDNEHVLPKFRVTIHASLKFCISIFGWNLIASHPLYTQNEQSVKFVSVRDLLNSLESFLLCCGVPKGSCVAKTVEDPTGSHSSGKNIFLRHTISVYQDAEEHVTDAGVERSPFFRFPHSSGQKYAQFLASLALKLAVHVQQLMRNASRN